MNDPAFLIALENFKNWRKYAKLIKEKAEKILNDKNLKVFVFGSVAEGKYNIGTKRYRYRHSFEQNSERIEKRENFVRTGRRHGFSKSF